MLEGRVVPSTLTVTSSADDGSAHTLRWAVDNAQSGDTIQITAAVQDPIDLMNGELYLANSVTIQSVPSRTPTIDAEGNSRIFAIAQGATVTLSNLNLTDGNGLNTNPNDPGGYNHTGGAILNFGTLTVSGCTFTSNSATVGGGLANEFGGTATVSGCTFTNNSAGSDGGGIANVGTATVSGSTFTSNSTVGKFSDGGGLYNSGTATVSGSTFTSNSAVYDGGGIHNVGTATVSGSTFTSNSAGSDGGGIFNGGTLNQPGNTNTFNGNTPNAIGP
jgi:predicted outer membrane repeat protein